MKVACEECGRELRDDGPGTYVRTSGWVKVRTAGGGNAVALPEREPRFMCNVCIDLRKLHQGREFVWFEPTLPGMEGEEADTWRSG